MLFTYTVPVPDVLIPDTDTCHRQRFSPSLCDHICAHCACLKLLELSTACAGSMWQSAEARARWAEAWASCL